MDAGEWAAANTALTDGFGKQEAINVIELWRSRAADAVGIDGAELAGPFQRHLTARGTGVPTNFCLILTADEVHACKFDPRHISHPEWVEPDQFGKVVTSWPRSAVHAAEVEPGRMAWGVTFEIAGAKPIPCRTPALTKNPAAAIVISALGGELPGAA